MNKALAVILAGGKGSRLDPLTRDRAKPAVPFGGSYRIIDFSLSNTINSGIRNILVLTQYKAFSLDRHISQGWRNLFVNPLGEAIHVVPPQQRIDEQWYRGTADAVYQNIYAIEKFRPEYIVILAGDHIYKMNYREMVAYHQKNNADLTIGALQVNLEQAKHFGIMETDANSQVTGFAEKPDQPQPIPGESDHALASMGIYVFDARFLFEKLCQDATKNESAHDFGRDIIPSIIHSHRVFAFPFRDENKKVGAYWRDVGTLDAYYEANMDLIAVDPLLNMYDNDWPIRTYHPNLPPPKFIFSETGEEGRCGQALDSIVCPGTILSGGRAQQSILGANTRINSFAEVHDSILFDGVDIGRHSKIRRAIIDKGVKIPPETVIGYDQQHDRSRGFTVTESGITVIAKGEGIEHFADTALADY
ncbi:MAG: glucose-1-phosphate adenylyltransferase [Pirellulales bacterium]|jgi:glucose-1-phosphate adenylyltransferase|nr:glucose-1-phosphate adenylyltransferase [Pirellulales bacterium]